MDTLYIYLYDYAVLFLKEFSLNDNQKCIKIFLYIRVTIHPVVPTNFKWEIYLCIYIIKYKLKSQTKL